MTYECHCETCGSRFTKLRARGNMTVCPACKSRARIAAWKKAHPGRKREINRQWSAANREKDRALKAAWQKRNPEKQVIRALRRQAAERQRTPPWADCGAIKAIKLMAKRAKECTGIPFEVDHIIPLRGLEISGLNVPENMRVVPKIENALKGISYGP